LGKGLGGAMLPPGGVRFADAACVQAFELVGQQNKPQHEAAVRSTDNLLLEREINLQARPTCLFVVRELAVELLVLASAQACEFAVATGKSFECHKLSASSGLVNLAQEVV
jgi:hypothetical protein